MRYYIDYSTKNGLGSPAISLFLQGCDKPQKCVGCHNYELQEKSEQEIDLDSLKEKLVKQIEMFSKFHKQQHISFLGGEPLAIFNKDCTISIARWLKNSYPDIILTLYSYHYADDIEETVKSVFDFGVLGEFDIKKLNNGFLPSSSNQMIYDFKNKKILEPIYIGETAIQKSTV